MLYKAINKSNNHHWIVADNEKEARKIAVKSGFVKDSKNCSLSTENDGESYYDFFKDKGDDLTEVDEKKGIGSVKLGSGIRSTWRVMDVD
jgi:hypothetical protein